MLREPGRDSARIGDPIDLAGATSTLSEQNINSDLLATIRLAEHISNHSRYTQSIYRLQADP